MASFPPPVPEWRRGWRIVLGAAICAGTGAPLLYYVFSLFTLPLTEQFDATRGEMATVQALIGLGAISSPLLGWFMDRWGVRPVMAVCMAMVALVHLFTGLWVETLGAFAVNAAFLGFFGVGTGPVAFTRLVNSWFDKHRGLALGMASLGLSLIAMAASPIIAWLIETQGWRMAYTTLGLVAGLAGLPLVWLLTREAPIEVDTVSAATLPPAAPLAFWKMRDFWLLGLSLILMAIPGTGFISQLSPIIQEEGASATVAALAISAFTLGQVAGRLVSGALLDRYSPRWVAFLFTAVPAIGFLVLGGLSLSIPLALFAAAMIGVQQGSETDLFAYFVSRRFGLAHYGAVFGSVHGLGWIGNLLGILIFGWSHDATGAYRAAEFASAACLVVAAITIFAVRIGQKDQYA